MAGPAIRYWEFARALGTTHRVTLAMPNEVPPRLNPPPGVTLRRHLPETIDALRDRHEVIIFQGNLLRVYPGLRRGEQILVADLYDPIPLESLEQYKALPPGETLAHHTDQVALMNEQLKYADYFLCASERQRDLWLGALLTLGRINPINHGTIQQRVAVVPFGLPDAPPQPDQLGLRAEVGEEAFILLWGGGIWEWFDPLTVIHAVHELLPEYPDLRLVFLGTRHPNPAIPVMPMLERAESLARELGMHGKTVLFRPGWVDYQALQNHFASADLGVSAHGDTLETRYAFRTRILHYLWAGKPVITTRGDVLASVVDAHGAGEVVNYHDKEGWMRAIRRLRDPGQYAARAAGARALAETYRWSKVVQPLREICARAERNPDLPLEEGERRLLMPDYERESRELRAKMDELLNSTSWKVSAPLRGLKRWWQTLRN